MKPRCWFFFVGLVLAVVCLPEQSLAAGVISLASNQDGELLVLLTDGKLVHFDPLSLRYQQLGILARGTPPIASSPPEDPETGRRIGSFAFETLEPVRGLGVAIADRPEGEEIYITGFTPLSGAGYIFHVSCFTPAGKQRWSRRSLTLGVFAGAAADPVENVLYLSNTRTAEIFRMALDGDDERPTPFVRPQGAVVLGALALDLDHRRLFVADVARGEVLAVDLSTEPESTGDTRKLVKGLGEATALAWDATRSLLWISDRLAGEILAVDPDSGETVRSLRWSSPGTPSALTITASGDLWVGDLRSRRLVLFPADGAKPRRFRF